MESPVDVAVNCDLTLVVGPTEEQIRVKSAYLIEASKPFAAMLSPTWKPPDVDTVELPDDDAEAMLEICYALHHKYDQLQRPPSPETIFEIAIIADKYFLCDALADVAAAYWLIHENKEFAYTVDQQGSLGLMQLTAAARLLHVPAAFREYTRELVRHWDGSYNIGDPGCEDLFMDRRLSRYLELQRAIWKYGAESLFIQSLWISSLPKLNLELSKMNLHKCGLNLFESEIHPTIQERISDSVKKDTAILAFFQDWEGYRLETQAEREWGDFHRWN